MVFVVIGDNLFSDDTNQLKACQLAINLLTTCCLLCNVARNQATRLLIEIAINPPVSPVFGAVIKPDPNSLYSAELSLLKENIKQVCFIVEPQEGKTGQFHDLYIFGLFSIDFY